MNVVYNYSSVNIIILSLCNANCLQSAIIVQYNVVKLTKTT